MLNKISLFIVFFISVFGYAQDLNQIRSQYPNAVESAEITSKLNGELSTINQSSKSELKAYKGAVLTLMAKFAKSKKDKKQFFKDGVALIESAINADPKSIEQRYIRLSVQENSPKFLGYHKNMEEDKQFIMENYPYLNSRATKAVLRNFVLKSGIFSESEKQSFM